LYNADYASDIKYSPAGFNQAMAAYGGYIDIVKKIKNDSQVLKWAQMSRNIFIF
jgi:hypothetical protein